MESKPNLIVDLTFSFSLKIISFTEILESQRNITWLINYSEAVLPSGQMLGKLKGQRVRAILDISVRSLIRKLKRQNIG